MFVLSPRDSAMTMTAPLTLDAVNAASRTEFVEQLRGIWEHSPWVVERAADARPFASVAALKLAMTGIVRDAPPEHQLELLRAHPELAGKAMLDRTLTEESTHEQRAAGLTRSSDDELAELAALNAAYREKFGWPFILAVRGPRGIGLTREHIIATFRRRLQAHPRDEMAECLRNIFRIVELRLDDRFGIAPAAGNRVWDWAADLARHTDTAGQLTVTYLTDAHRACAAQLRDWMHTCGFDDVSIDAIGNVVGIYHGADPHAARLLTGSHYDTVRNAGRYDGRLGVLVPIEVVRELAQRRERMPFGVEVVAFAEEEGQRYGATFLGSSALVGRFEARWLDLTDTAGITMRDAMLAAGLPGTYEAIAALRREPANYLGFVEVHIEQGPVLTDADLPLGVVTSINGSVRYAGEIVGMASHAGTTPMHHRRDAAAAAAELVSYAERRGAGAPDLVATVGVLEVPNGSINVVPGRCRFSLDVRATTDVVRDECAADIGHELAAICARRGVRFELTQTMSASAARCADPWRERWEHAVAALGLPIRRLPSGAGHDAMKLAEIMPQAMLFVRGQNGGISHNPLEAITNDDADLAVQAFANLLDGLAAEP
jgi:N-carbamoyl-L-amino-acid hydrolase